VPRGARVEDGEVPHHVVAKCSSDRLLFHDGADYARYLRLVAREVEDRAWKVFTYCLLPNHLHLLVRAPSGDLGPGLHRAHGDFARHLNSRHDQHGHVFGGRFFSRRVATDRYFAACLRYIARNPVAAGLAEEASAWRWSGHRALAAGEPSDLPVATREALALLGGPRPRERYVELVRRSEVELLSDLERGAAGDVWLLEALRHPGVTKAMLAEHLGISVTTLNRRLRAVNDRA
jgi:REP element-mobilizing transposase RayT